MQCDIGEQVRGALHFVLRTRIFSAYPGAADPYDGLASHVHCFAGTARTK